MMEEGKGKGRFSASILPEDRIDGRSIEVVGQIMDDLLFSYRYGYVVEGKHDMVWVYLVRNK